MLDDYGFNLWANGYDKSVEVSDENNAYPFAGYKKVLNAIYGTVMKHSPASILDIGIGTGTLSAKLYDGGNWITGIDFSEKMLEKSQAKIPNATLMQFDFSKGLPPALASEKFDFIISTYAFHHLTNDEKICFIKSLLNNLNDYGSILIGDISFPDIVALEECKKASGNDWDDDEHYFVFSESSKLLRAFCMASFHQYSHCGGVLEIKKF